MHVSGLLLKYLCERLEFKRSVARVIERCSTAGKSRDARVGRYVKPIPKWVWLVSGLFAVALGLSGCEDTAAAPEIKPVDVDVAQVLVKRIRSWDEFNGRISAIE